MPFRAFSSWYMVGVGVESGVPPRACVRLDKVWRSVSLILLYSQSQFGPRSPPFESVAAPKSNIFLMQGGGGGRGGDEGGVPPMAWVGLYQVLRSDSLLILDILFSFGKNPPPLEALAAPGGGSFIWRGWGGSCWLPVHLDTLSLSGFLVSNLYSLPLPPHSESRSWPRGQLFWWRRLGGVRGVSLGKLI